MGRYMTKLANEAGFSVAGYANYGLEGAKLEMSGVTWYPTPHDDRLRWFGQTARAYAKDFGAHLVIGIHDNWHVPDDYAKKLDMPWLNWFPIDHTPPSLRVIRMAKQADWPCVYSDWSKRQLSQEGIDAIHIPIGIDTKIYQPFDKREARIKLGWPSDAFIMSMVASNVSFPSRKGYPEAMQILDRVLREDIIPQAHLYCHCDHQFTRGINLVALAKTLGIESRVVLTDRCQYELGYSDQHMAMIYSASDLVLMPSRGEGFGMPAIEAQACCCPVIGTHFSSLPELIVHGDTVDFEQLSWVKHMGWYAVPSVTKFVDKIHQWYNLPLKSKGQLMAKGFEHAKSFDWHLLWQDNWLPLLNSIEAELC